MGASNEITATVAVLICRVFGGRVPSELAPPDRVELKVSLGTASCTKRCSELHHPEMNHVSSDFHSVIDRLGRFDWDVARIAEVVGKDTNSVQRIMRKNFGWNIELLQRLCVHVRRSDIEESPNVQLAILIKGKSFATGSVPLMDLLNAKDVTHRTHITCTGMPN